MQLDLKSAVMKHVTVTRVLLIVVLGCAAVSIHWAFQMRSECVTVCTNVRPRSVIDNYDTGLRTTFLPFMSSATSKRGVEREYHRDKSHRSVAKTTSTAGTDQSVLKSTTVHFPSTSHVQSSSVFQVSASVEGECTIPLFCSSKFVRSCITNEIIGHIPDAVRSQQIKSPKSRSVETSHMRRQSFKKVFDTRAWGHDWDLQHRGLNASGEGATLPWTQETMATLHSVINQLKQLLGVQRIRLLDVPCGDMAWMSRFLKTRDDVDYTGVDIVPDIIRHHQRNFASFGWRFYEWDVVRDGLEFSNASFDLILCRTLLQHLYAADVLRTLAHLSSVPFKYRQRVFLLTTSFSKHPQNEELEITDDNPGRYRRLNLELPPVSLVPPLCLVRDGPPDAREAWVLFLGLWELPLHIVSHCGPFATFTLGNSGQSLTSCVDWSLKP